MGQAIPLAIGSILPFVVVAAVVVVLVVVVARSGSSDSWSTARRGGSAGDDVVCPRCYHRTPPDATNCPECGKQLS